jgi:hypothetical protein
MPSPAAVTYGDIPIPPTPEGDVEAWNARRVGEEPSPQRGDEEVGGMENGVGGLPVDPAAVAALVRESYEVDLGEARAFLPGRVPLDDLPPAFGAYLRACAQLPERYGEDRGGVRRWLDREFRRDDRAVRRAVARLSGAQRDRLMTTFSVLGHTYRWDCVPPRRARFDEQRIALPPGIAGPWAALARICGQPRVGTTWSLHLCNWRMTDRPGGAPYRTDELTADNVRVAHNWLLPPVDRHLERFSISFVLLEARSAPVLRHLVEAVEAAASRQADDAIGALGQLHGAITAMTRAFSMNVRSRTIDPAIWLRLVQPTFAWSAAVDVPGRVEGGPSGMQVPCIQALDAALGVEGDSALAELARVGRHAMPRPHRRFLQSMERAGPVIRAFVRTSGRDDLTEQFNRCVRDLGNFRATHRARGAQYLRNCPAGDSCRASTGLSIGLDDDPSATFEHTMAERAAETHAALLAAVGRPC